MSAPTPMTPNDEKTWNLISHFGGAAGAFVGGGAGGWIAPLVSYVAKGNESPNVKANAAQALNFQILMTAITIVGWILACVVIGFVGIFAAWALGTIFGILAGVKVNNGQPATYPFNISLVK